MERIMLKQEVVEKRNVRLDKAKAAKIKVRHANPLYLIKRGLHQEVCWKKNVSRIYIISACTIIKLILFRIFFAIVHSCCYQLQKYAFAFTENQNPPKT